MTAPFGEYELGDSLARIDFARVHGWLTTAYWSEGVARERVERAARHSSMVVGVYHGDLQVAFLRVVSDKTTFAYIGDVFVDEANRRRGLARAMIRFAMSHPEHQGLRRWILATRDAHGVYRKADFQPLPAPERWMTHVPKFPPEPETPQS